jgi:hypothetical protein
MYSDSEDVPQIRANLQEFLRLLKETTMGSIQDQEQERSIIEFLDDIDPDYDPEFLALRNREGPWEESRTKTGSVQSFQVALKELPERSVMETTWLSSLTTPRFGKYLVTS